ncbi:MAG: hypothetical protein KA436_10465 [Oligoflexales bacterium]|nr:hypothetical protein [Oligoflexales bacterium]
MKSRELIRQVLPSWGRLEKPLDQATFIVYDLETTGGNPEKNGIMEIGALKFVNGVLDSSFYSMVNPMRPLSSIVRRITGISPKDFKKSPPIEEVFPSFLEFIEDHILVSHNAQGDLKFLVHFAQQACAHKLENFYLCTHLLGQKFFANAPDKSLVGLARHLDLPHDEETLHRAREDAQLTWELFRVILTKLEDHGIKDVKEAVRFQGDYASGLRLGPAVDLDKLKEELPNAPGVFTLIDRNGRSLFVSSSLHLKREVLSLRNLNALPRKLLKIVLESREIRIETCSNIFTAMLRESELVEMTGRGEKPFLSNQWTGRFIGALFLSEDGEDLHVGLGSLLVPGLMGGFGPVRDYKSLLGKLQQLSQKIDRAEYSNSGLYLSKQEGEDVSALFSGFLLKEQNKVWWDRFQLKNLVHLGRQKELKKRLERIQSIREMDLLGGLDDLLEQHGLLVVSAQEEPGSDTPTWLVYPILFSSPLEPRLISEDPKIWLEGSEAEAMLSELQEQSKVKPDRNYDLRDLLRMNAVLWAIYVQAQQRHAKEFYKAVPLA